VGRGGSEASVCSRLTAGITGSNPAEDMDVRLLCVLYVVQVAASAKGRRLVQRRPTGFVCRIVCALETSKMRRLGPEAVFCAGTKNIPYMLYGQAQELCSSLLRGFVCE